ELRQPPKVRSNSHCFGSPITALLNRIRRPSSYTVGEYNICQDRPRSTVSGIISASQEGVSRATRKSIHGISSAFASLRGKKYGEDSETVYIFNFVSPTLFLYGKDLRQAASKKLAEWEKLEASRTKEEKELREMIARHFIVDCSAFIFLDNAGAASMRQVHRELADRNIRVYYAAARDSVRGFFLDLDESDRVPPSAFYPTIDCAVQVAKAYRDSPPHITVNGLSDEEMVEEDGITNENEGDELTKDELSFYLPALQDTINLLIAINRLIALCFPVAYRHIFTARWTYVMIVTAILCAIVYAFPSIGAQGFAFDIGPGNASDAVKNGEVGRIVFQTLPWVILLKTLSPPLLLLATNRQMRRELKLVFYMAGLQDLINLLIASNRICALCFPFIFPKIFTSQRTYWMILAAIYCAIIYIFPIIGAPGFAFDISARSHTEPVKHLNVEPFFEERLNIYLIAAKQIA
ncbi:hypothetical protein PFISCL1PPCAC_9103, partial [Pristionchus fissidentatus]